MRAELNNTFALASFTLGATDKGHIYPQMHDLVIDYAQSQIYVDDSPLTQGYYRQMFQVFKYVSMSAINAFGKSFGNVLLPEVTRRLLNGQKHEFKFGFP